MIRFLDTHRIGLLTKEQLMELQESPIDESGVVHINMLYEYEANSTIASTAFLRRLIYGCRNAPCKNGLQI
jgi:hypothetical protein